MLVSAEGKVIKVGNSSAIILPKIVFDHYKIEQGNTLKIVMTEKGLFIPAEQNESNFIQKEIENALKSVSGKGGKK